METSYEGSKDIEQLVQDGRNLLRTRRSSLNLSLAIHFASFPNNGSEPVSPPYSLPWYIRRNLSALASQNP